ncbi:helix-turn-helix domain-containing protein [Paenibacillus sp. NRS-1782]|uniref:helix-turn-helix domain-containing protein n=1 Tax=unclassified Paenibacillus TaxID=185978 RepID=UPI003D2DEE32
MLTYEPLRLLMVKRNLDREELVRLTGITRPTVGKLFSDKLVALDVLDKVCVALDVELHDVVRRKKEQEDI